MNISNVYLIVRVLTMVVDSSVGSDLAPLPAQQILAADPNLLNHCLVLSSFKHDSKIDPKETEIESVKDESWRLAMTSFANYLILKAEKLNSAFGYVIG